LLITYVSNSLREALVETTISSKTKSVVIGPQLSFVIISEWINLSGRK